MSLIKKSLFILIVYSWTLADKVTWPYIWEGVQNIIKTNTTLRKARQIQSGLNPGELGVPSFSLLTCVQEWCVKIRIIDIYLQDLLCNEWCLLKIIYHNIFNKLSECEHEIAQRATGKELKWKDTNYTFHLMDFIDFWNMSTPRKIGAQWADCHIRHTVINKNANTDRKGEL